MIDEKLEIYYLALDRLVRAKPKIVSVDDGITLRSVAIEAGRSPGAIKKSREIYTSLIADIRSASKRERDARSSQSSKLEAMKAKMMRYKRLYEESLAREVVLLSKLLDVDVEGKQ